MLSVTVCNIYSIVCIYLLTMYMRLASVTDLPEKKITVYILNNSFLLHTHANNIIIIMKEISKVENPS